MVQYHVNMKVPTPTVIICPGNGCSNIRQSNWYGVIYDKLIEKNIPCICKDFPDPLHARRDRWVPFMRSVAEEASPDDPSNVILVGHSSGAQATLRYTEQYPVHGAVLVSATYSDLGDAHERMSGYYPQGDTNPYLFQDMLSNCKRERWYQFHSDDDPFIPLYEAEKIRDGLGLTSTYNMLTRRSHFFDYFDELETVIDVLIAEE